MLLIYIFVWFLIQDEFENLFKAFDDEAFVQYLKCFRRARVVFSSALLAAKARIHLHETELGGKTLKCYFAQVSHMFCLFFYFLFFSPSHIIL